MSDAFQATLPRTEKFYLFMLRVFVGWSFTYSSIDDEIRNPRFTATHVVPVANQPGIFHFFFSIFAQPDVAPIIGFLVSYGHFLVGLAILFGFMFRLSASIGIVLMALYFLVQLHLPDPDMANHSIFIAPIVYAYRMGVPSWFTIYEHHLVWLVILAYLLYRHAGHIWGLDSVAVRIPFVKRLRICN